jgi:hypothetical protein
MPGFRVAIPPKASPRMAIVFHTKGRNPPTVSVGKHMNVPNGTPALNHNLAFHRRPLASGGALRLRSKLA